jgi:hypothetical protein
MPSNFEKPNHNDKQDSFDTLKEDNNGLEDRLLINLSSLGFDEENFFDESDVHDLESSDLINPSVYTNPEDWQLSGESRSTLMFSSQPGMTFESPAEKNCLFYFEKFFDDEMVNLIVEETNLYASQFFLENPFLKPNSRFHKWSSTNPNEIRIFVALLILQGIVYKPS